MQVKEERMQSSREGCRESRAAQQDNRPRRQNAMKRAPCAGLQGGIDSPHQQQGAQGDIKHFMFSDGRVSKRGATHVVFFYMGRERFGSANNAALLAEPAGATCTLPCAAISPYLTHSEIDSGNETHLVDLKMHADSPPRRQPRLHTLFPA